SWQELLALLGTIEPTELIDPTIGAERLLYRLFHEHGVRVFGGVPVADQCSCSRDKIRGILEGFSAQEIKDSTEDGGIHVACEFCSTQYDFDPAEFTAQ
ncbi:Hsp33 family molecular chaperone, partial [Mesorhizobium sp. M7D.F.Ca.US.004.03.1.1]